jgi:hypothetical protein
LAQRTQQLVFAPALAVSALCPQRRIVAALRAALPADDVAAEARVTRAAARSGSPA